MKFSVQKKIPSALGRAGLIETPHGLIETPAFVVVATKATVKAVTPEQVAELGSQAVLANTYHLYLQPGDELVRQSGNLHNFMNWAGPMFTDSGGFQVFSLGAAFGQNVSKVASREVGELLDPIYQSIDSRLAKIDNDGVTFRSHLDGSRHRLTPERSIEIQHNLGADIIFAFDECTSPEASLDYQKQALGRTHYWAERSLAEHKCRSFKGSPALFGIVQGGRSRELREESARFIGGLPFDGFGIGGSFTKKDIGTAVSWVNRILPEEKPRHLLGLGEPRDLFAGVRAGVDTFDCVIPTRMARHGQLFTKKGKINISNHKYRADFSAPENGCACYLCRNYSRAYLAHLFRAGEMLAATLASIHNLYFIVNLTKRIRQSILDGNFKAFETDFMTEYNV